MSTTRLYCPALSVGRNVISDDEAHHALGALRIKVGDQLILFDGNGTEGHARVTSVDRKQLLVEVAGTTVHEFDVAVPVTLAVAMPKTHRQGYLIEKCTELGVAAIWPIETERSVTKPGATAVEKWRRRAIEAAKQSGRRWIPQIESPQCFHDVVARRDEFQHAAFAHTIGAAVSSSKWLATVKPGETVLIFIGPEGGWTEEECGWARDADLSLVRLAPTVLRTETAAVAVCAAVAALCGATED